LHTPTFFLDALAPPGRIGETQPGIRAPGFVLAFLILASALGGTAFAGEGPVVFLIPLDDAVDVGRADFISKAVDRAVKSDDAVILFEIDSPGGAVSSLGDILNDIVRARTAGVRTVAWIRGNAWSAAAILAIACDRVYMNRSSSLGAAQPVFISPVPTGDKPINPAGEKMTSAIRTQARSHAENTGRSPALAEAMVDPDVAVYEAIVRGERRFLTETEWEGIQSRSLREGFEAEIVGTVIEKGKILSLSAKQALDVGFADGMAATRDEVLEAEGLSGAELVGGKLTWSQNLANVLTSPLVSMLLLILGIGGIYMEIKAPGFGLPGILGICALFLFFFGKYAVGLAEVHEILIFFAGVVLILVEVFITPGFGVPGVAGILLMVAGLLLASQDFLYPTNEAQWALLRSNAIFTTLSLAGAVVLLLFMGTVLPRSPLFRRMALRAPITETPQTGSAVPDFAEGLVGIQGRAETHLRPSGKGRFEGGVLDVVTQGDFVRAGEMIEVREVEGNRIVVESIEPSEPAEEERA